MTAWPVQDAKARFGELLSDAVSQGPQVVTKHGVEMAVAVPIEIWRRMEAERKPTLKDWLLAPSPRLEGGVELPDRKKMRFLSRDLELE